MVLLRPNITLILGRDGTSKTELFRYMSESTGSPTIVVHGPWTLSVGGFKEAERIIDETTLEWRNFWVLYICNALQQETPTVPLPQYLEQCDLASEKGLLDGLESTAKTPRASLELNGWLQKLDGAAEPNSILLFDGLDTRFGSTREDRERRSRSTEGLFGVWMDRGQTLTNLHFKIFLRENVWNELNFQNKSHLYGRFIRLWTDTGADIK